VERPVDAGLGRIGIQLQFELVPGNEFRHCGEVDMSNSETPRPTEPSNKENRRRGNPLSARASPPLSSRLLQPFMATHGCEQATGEVVVRRRQDR
jgi:hypothetical protein